jgi:hypothetical protein
MTITYYLPDQIKCNGNERLIPPTFCERLIRARPDQQCLILQPGDVIEPDTNTVIRGSNENYWGENLEGLIENVQRYAKEIAPNRPPFVYGRIAESLPALLEFLKERVAGLS